MDNISDYHFLGIPVCTRIGIWDTQKIRKRTSPFSKKLGKTSYFPKVSNPPLLWRINTLWEKKFSLVPVYMYICFIVNNYIFWVSFYVILLIYKALSFMSLECQRLNILFQSIKEYYKNDITIAPFQRAKYAFIRVVLQF